jgi:isoquinoline 1-oxidoreductase subunit beta
MSKNLNAGSATTRRQFLSASTATTGGLVLAFNFPFMNQALAQSAQGHAASEVNAWVVVNPDDSIVIRIARSEMGQGTLTGLAQLVTEELDGNWAKVSTEYPTPTLSLSRNRVWGNYATVGSRGIRESQDYVRKGGAAAKMMLVQAAADEWKVPAAECTSANSVITHTPSGRTVTYGKVAAAASKLTAPASVVLKLPKDWKLVGKRVARLDTVDKTNGTQIYGMDVTLPGMLNAAVKDCPVFGGKLKSFNASAITGRKGVKHVLRVSDSMVAVVADTWWQAKSALDVLPIEWDEGPNAQFSSTAFAAILKTALDTPEAVIGNQVGDSKKAIAESAKRIEAVYSYPHQNHATMESMNATVVFTTDAAGVAQRCQVWTPTQNAEAALAATSETSGLPAAKCEVYKMHLGGGFGRRGGTDWIIQAVSIAKQIPNTPIKMIWSREEDMLHGRYHPVTQCKLTAGLDAEGNVTGLHMRIAGQSILATVAPQTIRDGKDPVVFQGLNASGPEASIGYTFPNLLVDHAMRNPPVPAGFWRGVNLNQNAIYLECFVDEIAHATKQDPLALRRKLMFNHPKHLAVLNAVAAKAGWDKPAPKGIFRGIAQTMGYGSYVAACAEVSVSDAGVLKIHRIVASTDSGYVVNPQQIEAQVEGSFAYGLSAALYGECTVKNGRIEQTNFNNYPVVKMADMPPVETVMVPSGGFWGGVGEPTIAVAAPAVLNAIFAATGKRIRNLPLKDQNLKRA